MTNKVRSSQEVADLIAKTMAEADALKAKEDMSPEDVTALENLVAQLEGLQGEKAAADVSERMAKIKLNMEQPTKSAPRLTPVNNRDRSISAGEAMSLWLGSFGPEADRSPEVAYRLRTAGLECGNAFAKLPVNYDKMNRKNRTILSKGGSGTGADLVWQSYSDKVVEYLTYFSPVLNFVDSETTSDGNARSYFTIDDTSMESAYTSAGGGSETVPTIPDSNLATAVKVVNVFDITSGFQKITFNELRDSYVSLEDKIAKANSNSHARKLEREIFTASGNGTTGVQGITAACTSAGTPAAWTQDVVMNAINAIPPQYRKNVILASNDDTKNAINVALRDDIGRSMFDRTIEDDMEFDVLLGKKYIVSQYIAADVLLIFAPEFYKLRLVAGQQFQQFTERFWPNVAWAGLMSFGGAWVGPTTAAKKVTKT